MLITADNYTLTSSWSTVKLVMAPIWIYSSDIMYVGKMNEEVLQQISSIKAWFDCIMRYYSWKHIMECMQKQNEHL